MNDDEMRALWDGKKHEIGPLRLRHMGAGERGGESVCKVDTESASFALDWAYGQAIVYCIAPTRALWTAREPDKEPQANGKDRGWLRLEVRSSKGWRGAAKRWARRPFQIARLVTDARSGERVERIKGGRSTDYHRAGFKKVPHRSAKADTRNQFVQACLELAQATGAELPQGWRAEAEARWSAADEMFALTAEANQALREEP